MNKKNILSMYPLFLFTLLFTCQKEERNQNKDKILAYETDEEDMGKEPVKARNDLPAETRKIPETPPPYDNDNDNDKILTYETDQEEMEKEHVKAHHSFLPGKPRFIPETPPPYTQEK